MSHINDRGHDLAVMDLFDTSVSLGQNAKAT